MRYKRLTGGLKYAYDDMTIRVWTSSWPYPGKDYYFRPLSVITYINYLQHISYHVMQSWCTKLAVRHLCNSLFKNNLL